MTFATRLAPTTYEPVTGWTYQLTREDFEDATFETIDGVTYADGICPRGDRVRKPLDTPLCQGCDAPVVDGKCDDCGIVFIDALPELDPSKRSQWL